MLRLTIVGEGILPTRDLSLGGLSRIREAELVVYTATWPGIGRWLDGLGVRKRRDLSDMYVEHEVDEVNYDRIVRWVLSLVKEHGDVVYLVPGTPSLGVSSTTRLLELARAEAGMECAVIPSVSSFDSVAMDLGVDFLDRGTIVVDANRLLI